MDTTLPILGATASILAVLLAFCTIFINGRAIRRMLGEQRRLLERQSTLLERQSTLLERQSTLLERQTEILGKLVGEVERIPEKTVALMKKG